MNDYVMKLIKILMKFPKVLVILKKEAKHDFDKAQNKQLNVCKYKCNKNNSSAYHHPD